MTRSNPNRHRSRLAGLVALTVLAILAGLAYSYARSPRMSEEIEANVDTPETSVQPEIVTAEELSPRTDKEDPVESYFELSEEFLESIRQSVDALAESENRKAELEAVRAAVLGALQEKTLEGQAQHYLDYIALYPLSSDTPLMMMRLATVYVNMGRFEDALDILQQAQELVGDDRFQNVINLDMGRALIQMGEYDLSVQVLSAVMNQDIPDSVNDPWAVYPQAFKAPTLIGKAYQQMGMIGEAERMYEVVRQRAVEMYEDNPRVDWLPSYVRMSYMSFINLALTSDPPDYERARQWNEAFREYMPDYSGPAAYTWIAMEINNREAGVL